MNCLGLWLFFYSHNMLTPSMNNRYLANVSALCYSMNRKKRSINSI